MRTFYKLCTSALMIALAGCGDAPTHPASAKLARAGGTPGDATVASTLTITSFYCYDVGGGGIYYNITNCSATSSGGAGGNTWDWDVIVNQESSGGNSSWIEGVCTDSYPVTVTVRDVAGAVASASETFVCYAKSPGNGSGIEP